jgi:DNA-binding transcriptional MocR family regulator
VSTKYSRIADELIEKITAGQIKEAEKLPSIRDMSQYYKCNKATVIQAYRLLEAAHYCYSIPKSGYYVIRNKREKASEQEAYDFSQVQPLQETLPYREFHHSMNKAIEKYSESLFQYGQAEGLMTTRKALASLFASQYIYTDKEHILITTGANQGLDILMRAISGARLLVEQPTYSMLINMARMNNIELLGIPRREDGVDFNLLESYLKKCNYFYTIPRLSNPSGYSYTEQQKKKIAEIARRNNVIIIEDDYLGDFLPAGKDYPIYYHDSGYNTIYVKSFSKGFLPGVRLGAVIFPRSSEGEILQNKCRNIKELTDYGTNIFSQGALETFIHSGMYHRHLTKIQAAYPDRMKKIKAFLMKRPSEVISWNIPDNGIFITMSINGIRNTDWINNKLLHHGIKLRELSDFYIERPKEENPSYRLCISALPIERVYEGLSELYKIFG